MAGIAACCIEVGFTNFNLAIDDSVALDRFRESHADTRLSISAIANWDSDLLTVNLADCVVRVVIDFG